MWYADCKSHLECLNSSQIRRDKLTPDEVEDVPKEYRFLDADGDPIVPAKEKISKLEKCVRRDEKGNLSFWIKPK